MRPFHDWIHGFNFWNLLGFSSYKSINFIIHYKKSRFFFIGNFGEKQPPPWFICPHVHLDQSANFDKLMCTWPFWLGLFGFFYWVFFTWIVLLNHLDNN
jgi:hypothetical protein